MAQCRCLGRVILKLNPTSSGNQQNQVLLGDEKHDFNFFNMENCFTRTALPTRPLQSRQYGSSFKQNKTKRKITAR